MRLLKLFKFAQNLFTWLKAVEVLRRNRKELQINPDRIFDAVERASLRVKTGPAWIKEALPFTIKFKSLLTRVEPYNLIRIGRNGDGGYIIPSFNYDKLITIGVGKEFSFERDDFLTNTKITMFDHTIHSPSSLPENIKFFKKGIGEASEGSLMTFDDICAHSKINAEERNILKVDIEGAEYDVFENSKFSAFSVLVFEIHWLEKVFYSDKINKLENLIQILLAEHEIVHVHANNWGKLFNFANIVLPDIVELTLVRRIDLASLSNKTKQGSQDFPCRPDFPEIWPAS